MKRKYGKGRNPPGEHWTKMFRHTMETPAWRALSTTAQALYPWLKLEWRGPNASNNGSIQLSTRQAAVRLGVSPTTAAEAFRDLQRKGFIVQTEPAHLGFEGAAKSPSYELTEIKMAGSEKDGRKLYRDWQPGCDFPVQMAAANNPNGHNGRGIQKTKPQHQIYVDPDIEIMTKTGTPT